MGRCEGSLKHFKTRRQLRFGAESVSRPNRIIAENIRHSVSERRYFCIGKVDGEILTVRFTWRTGKIRIFGAGYWRKGKQVYEEEQH